MSGIHLHNFSGDAATFPVGSTTATFSGDVAIFPVGSLSATFSGAATYLVVTGRRCRKLFRCCERSDGRQPGKRSSHHHTL